MAFETVQFAVMVPDTGGASELAALALRLIEVVREPSAVRPSSRRAASESR